MLRQVEANPNIIVTFAEQLRVRGKANALEATFATSPPQVCVDLLRLRHVHLEQLEAIWGALTDLFHGAGRPVAQ